MGTVMNTHQMKKVARAVSSARSTLLIRMRASYFMLVSTILRRSHTFQPKACRRIHSTRIALDMSKSLPQNTYCHAAKDHEIHGPYHDDEYGFPIRNNDNALFERLVLEINQAGLNWLTILKKREGIVDAYDEFDIATVASYGDSDIERLRSDPRVIRNKLKINAAIYNARKILELRESNASFEAWLNSRHPLSKTEWVALFKKTFKFTGGEITTEFLKSLGYLPGAHHTKCAVFKRIAKENPPWMSVPKDFDWDL